MPIHAFIHELSWPDLPDAVQHQAVRCLLDTLGTAVAGRQTDCSRIIYDFAAAFGGKGARLWLDGRAVSPPGAALAHAMTIDSLDIHDGYNLVKGHIGAAEAPPTDDELRAQFRWLAGEMLPPNRVHESEETIWRCAELADANALNQLLI